MHTLFFIMKGMELWLSGKQSSFANIVDMKRRNGWENVRDAIRGMRWLKKRK